MPLSPGSGTARYLVYSTDPSLNTLSGLSDAGIHIFNKTYSGYAPGSVTQTGDLFLYSLAPIITVTANNQNMTYGGNTLPSLTYSLSGLIDNDTSSILTGAPTISTAATAYNGTVGSGSNAGTYTITAALNNLANSIGYSLSTVNSTLTVNKATLTVTADNQTRLYGQSNPTFTETVSGYVNGDTAAILTGSATGSSVATNTTGIGTATITGSTAGFGVNDGNYTFAAANGTLTINKAHLTVTADDQSMTYGGSSLPTLTDTITGYMNGEGSGVISGSASLSTSATAYNGTAGSGSNAGAYTITAGNGTLSAANYDFTPVNGTLTVNKATLTVTADNQTRLYGAANPTFTETVSGYQNGDTAAILTGSATGNSTATTTTGVGTATITGSGGTLGVNDGNYTFAAPVNGTLTINKAHLTVTADNQSMSYGAGSLPGLTDTITGYMNSEGSGVLSGSPTLSTTATAYNGTAGSGSNAGTYTITAGNGTLSAANYDFTPVNGTLTVNKAHLTVTADNQSMSYGEGSLPSLTDTITGYLDS